MRDLRICFLGDSFTAGVGDETGLGWVGRVTAQAWARGVALTPYNLGVRRDTSADMLRRAGAEVLARLLGNPGDGQGLVLCCGGNDTTFLDDAPRVPPAQVAENVREILAWGAARWPVLLLGVPPICHDAAHDARAAALEPVLAAVAAELEVPFLPLHAALAATPAWRAGTQRRDGVHPDGAGYAVLAGLVEAWPAWRALVAG
ncbi:GDSL-type esterase/lipase family protein [Siccirubricoccus sp. KC 17139]|uniref:GDSL-type esterase/lipase family protein n=1 Tax=Siccirubricoccus soli TaxID=2899147 RepID=A0ABT1D8N0_9PROT|nr:GDSL-type esterase/lipase family protein [Siccirubricoccus soli]MCO6417539.1 GDSL-type esterase/lipase family protein [Siccirubricoccus soli]MCP2683674.1 GDSL-type esterase/lipase family protein [Siccirubricoccus soli]